MNIQPNLSIVNLTPSPKKTVSKALTGELDVEKTQAKDQRENSPLTSGSLVQSELFQQIEALDNSQKANLRFDDTNMKNQKSIQSYLDNQALETQSLRDELQEQLGIDLSV